MTADGERSDTEPEDSECTIRELVRLAADDPADPSEDSPDEERKPERVGHAPMGDEGKAVIVVGNCREADHHEFAEEGQVGTTCEDESEPDRCPHQQGDAEVSRAIHGQGLVGFPEEPAVWDRGICSVGCCGLAQRNLTALSGCGPQAGYMVALLVEEVIQRTGPFIIPVVVFAFGLVGYGLLYLYSRWRDGEFTGTDPDDR